ncbi:MAG: FAD-binding protein [Ktedonobacteraceae bacterium]|nr:FAD-binding protein [Ktedonobacteraceae bacterium]
MLKENVLSSLKNILPEGQIFMDRASLIAYEADAGVDKGLPDVVVFPHTAEEVARVVSWASQYGVPIVARGAGTGLSGGAVADRGGIILEFSHMDRLLEIDVHGRSAVAEPALINLRLDERAKTHGLYFPPDPASQRASTIGGNVAENSGGPHCFKYGVTTNYVIGMDVVLANGQHIRVGGHALDYPEYDLCGLITGSEGMLGLITSITVRLLRMPPGVKTLLAIFDSVEQAGNAVSAVIATGFVPATMEMMDQQIIRMVEPFAHAGLPLDAGAILIIDIDGYPASIDEQMNEIADILQGQHGYGLHIANNEEERARIWLARKSAGGAIARLVPSYYSIDITVPRSRLAEILTEVNKICESYNLRTGHVLHAGDGNLHPMLLIPEPENQELMQRIHAAAGEIIQCSVEMGGSLTGEHGVGIEKREHMSLMHKPIELMAMWDVKQAFDPNNILNPGKLFPPSKRDDTGPFAGYIMDYPLNNQPRESSIQPGETFAPTTAEEAAQELLAFTKAGQSVYINGSEPRKRDGTKATSISLSTRALRGVKMYAPDDLYITVGAGTPLTEIQEFLARDRRQIALASPWPEATLGGLVASNTNAPLRMRYGSIRDLVLSTTIALANGNVIRTGRPIVKNVAGYDLTKVFVGSHGTPGLIVDITLKLMALPRTRRTLLIPIEDLRYGLIWGRRLLPLALNASAITINKGSSLIEADRNNYLLAYTVEGMPKDVQAELDQVRQVLSDAGVSEAREVAAPTGTDIWAEMLGRMASRTLQVRIGIPNRNLPAYIQDQAALLNEGAFSADISNGLIYAIKEAETHADASTWLETLREAALIAGGYAVVIDMPASLNGKIDRWGYQPEGLALMKALKARWDPQSILNPGIFVGGI